jgi:hypothetical protein
MRRAGRERPGGSASVFVRPVMMLVIGVTAGLVMWWVLMRGTFEAVARGTAGVAAGPPNDPADTVGAAQWVGTDPRGR